MSLEITVLSVILTLAVVLFAMDLFPVDKVGLIVLTLLILTRLVTPSEAIAGFANPAVLTVASMLALSYAVQRSGALHYFANRILDSAVARSWRFPIALLAAVGGMSAFINNTMVVALFLPLTLAFSRERNLNPGQLLMPMSFAATVAGTCTLVGTSANLVVYALLMQGTGISIGIFEPTPMGIIFYSVALIYLITVGRKLVPARSDRKSLTEDFRSRHFVTEFVVQKASSLVGKSVAETRLGETYGVEVLEVIRKSQRLLPGTAGTRLEEGDLLLVQGEPKSLVSLRSEAGLRLKALKRVSGRDLENDDILLVEAFISPSSRLVESTLKQVDFRRTFKATALALRSHGRTIREKIGRTKLEFGDSLLILTSQDQLQTLRSLPDFLVLEEVRVTFLDKAKVYCSVAIFGGVILAAAAGWMGILEAALVGVGMMVLTGCLRLQDLYFNLSWQIVISIACLIPLGLALERTGLASTLGHSLVQFIGPTGPLAVLSAVYLISALLTSLLVNGAVAILMLPIALSTAAELQLNPEPFAMAVLFAVSTGFLTPIGYQTSPFIIGPGEYRFGDFLRAGGPLSFVFWLCATWLIPLFWPL